MVDKTRMRSMHPKLRRYHGKSKAYVLGNGSKISEEEVEAKPFVSPSGSEIPASTMSSVPNSSTEPGATAVQTEKSEGRVLSEEELKTLVDNAISRARQAANMPPSPKREILTNNGSSKELEVLSSAPTSSGHDKPPESPIKKAMLGFYSPVRSYMLERQASRVSGCSKNAPLSPSSLPSDCMQDDLNISSVDESDASLAVPTMSSHKTSDSIFRKVEEEIALARRAAQQGNRRLDGMSSAGESFVKSVSSFAKKVVEKTHLRKKDKSTNGGALQLDDTYPIKDEQRDENEEEAFAILEDYVEAGEERENYYFDSHSTTESKLVTFRKRYPVPPMIVKPRDPLDIMRDNAPESPDLNFRMAKPKKDLKELFEAATGSSLQRRSNACGALKVLTRQFENKLTLVRTEGFLDALVFAIEASLPSSDGETALDTRLRALSSILNISEPKENRFIVISHPSLTHCLVKCIIKDKGEARAVACSILATLAKSPNCRERLAKVESLLDTLAKIVKGIESEPVPGIEESSDDESSFSLMSSSTASSDDDSSSGSDDSSISSSRKQKTVENDEIAKRARLNACAALVHLSKSCPVTALLCSSETMNSLITGAKESGSPIHTKCFEVLCNITRFPANNAVLVKHHGFIDILVVGAASKIAADRLWALRAILNLSSDVSGKIVLANSVVLTLLSGHVTSKNQEEQEAATAALYNLSTEPGMVITLTNTKNVVATLVSVAHNAETIPSVRLMACDTLATIGLWLQTLAGSGTVPDGVEPTPLPSFSPNGWKMWD